MNLKIKMKKIIKALLGGFVLSMVLCALFPRTFLRDDARWTYQSNVGRMEIAFAGDVRNGQIDIQGKELRIYRPKWMLNGNYNQGIVVQFPISYLQKAYQITLKPRGSTKEMSLKMSFRGSDLRVHNQRKPAYVRFENIRVKGETITEEQTVWHDKPFRYLAKNISDSLPVTISFDVKKPISFADILWNRLIGSFIACLLLISCFDTLRRLVSGFNKKDIVQLIADNYGNIDVVHRRAFWIIFGVLCFAFGFHAIQFMWGNHDWEFVSNFNLLLWGQRIFEGRYAIYLFKKLFLRGVYLPLIYDVITFFFLALNGVLLCIYWKLEKRVVYFVLCGFILTAQPFTLSMMYYVHMLPEVFIGVTFALVALMLGEKIAFERISLVRKVVFALLSIVLINLSLAMYPVLLNTIAVVFIGRLLVQSFEWDGSWRHFKSRFIPFSLPAICIVLGIGLYKFIIAFVFPVEEFYNTKTLPLEQLPERLFVLFKQSLYQLYEYNSPFISRAVLWIFLGFTVLITLYVCWTGNFKQKLVRLILLVGSLYATQATMMISAHHIIADRIELFGLVPFEMLMTVLVFTKLKKMHNLSVLAATGVIWVSIVNDLDCLRVWKLGFDAEKMLWNRVLNRIETQADFDIDKKYKVVRIGRQISMRPRFAANSTFGSEYSLPLVSFGYDLYPFDSLAFYYPINFVSWKLKCDTDLKYLKSGNKDQLRRLWEAGILDKARAWPHENGLIVWKDVILFVTDAKLLEEYKKQLAQEFPRQSQITP